MIKRGIHTKGCKIPRNQGINLKPKYYGPYNLWFMPWRSGLGSLGSLGTLTCGPTLSKGLVLALNHVNP